MAGFAGTNSFLSIDANSTFSSGGPVRAIHGLGGSCRVTISQSDFAGNHGTPYPGGRGNLGGALWSECETSVDHTTFTGNQAASGGAIFLTKDVVKADLRESGIHFEYRFSGRRRHRHGTRSEAADTDASAIAPSRATTCRMVAQLTLAREYRMPCPWKEHLFCLRRMRHRAPAVQFTA